MLDKHEFLCFNGFTIKTLKPKEQNMTTQPVTSNAIPDAAELTKGKTCRVYLVYGADGVLLDVSLSETWAKELIADEDEGAYSDPWTCG